MMTRDFNMGFFGRKGFGHDARTKFREEWMKMSDSERVDFINKKMEMMEKAEKFRDGFCRHGEMSVEAIDARCKEWMDKTPEAKEEFVLAWKEAMHQRHEWMK